MFKWVWWFGLVVVGCSGERIESRDVGSDAGSTQMEPDEQDAGKPDAGQPSDAGPDDGQPIDGDPDDEPDLPFATLVDDLGGVLDPNQAPPEIETGECGLGDDVQWIAGPLGSDATLAVAPSGSGSSYVFVSALSDDENWVTRAVNANLCDVQVLDTATEQPGGVVTTYDYLFWTRDYQDSRRWSTESALTQTYESPSPPLAADEGHIYGVSYTSFWRSEGGEDFEDLAVSPLNDPDFPMLSVDSEGAVIGMRDRTLDSFLPDRMVYVDWASGKVTRVPLPEYTGLGQGPVCYHGDLFYCGNDGIVRTPLPGTEHTRIIDTNCEGRLVVEGSGIYWLTRLKGGAVALAQAARDGAHPHVIAETGTFSVDEAYVYWVTPDGYLLRTPKTYD